MRDTVVHHMLRTLKTLALGAAFTLSASALQAQDVWPSATAKEITVEQLPPQGQATYQLIFQGGPFPYDKDGSVFGNRERLLPAQRRGYYREYTVPTPRAKDRGARRIVCGGLPPTQPQACYYTRDHYNSFQKITP